MIFKTEYKVSQKGGYMNNFAYPVTLTPDEEDGGFVVTFPDLPQAITQGEDIADALEQAADCLEEAIVVCMRLNENLPKPSQCGETDYLVYLPAQTAVKALLYNAMRASDISKVDFAKVLKCDEKEVRRLLNPRHSSHLPRIESALQALGYKLVISGIPNNASPCYS